MNRREAIKVARRAFASLTPRVPSGFCAIDGAVIVPLHGSGQSLVVYGDRDLSRLKCMIEIAEAEQARRKAKR